MTVIDIKPDAQGKVRDIYDLGDKLLMVATDRISAFDYILDNEIPNKGRVLTQLSLFWHAGEEGRDVPRRVHRSRLLGWQRP